MGKEQDKDRAANEHNDNNLKSALQRIQRLNSEPVQTVGKNGTEVDLYTKLSEALKAEYSRTRNIISPVEDKKLYSEKLKSEDKFDELKRQVEAEPHKAVVAGTNNKMYNNIIIDHHQEAVTHQNKNSWDVELDKRKAGKVNETEQGKHAKAANKSASKRAVIGESMEQGDSRIDLLLKTAQAAKKEFDISKEKIDENERSRQTLANLIKDFKGEKFVPTPTLEMKGERSQNASFPATVVGSGSNIGVAEDDDLKKRYAALEKLVKDNPEKVKDIASLVTELTANPRNAITQPTTPKNANGVSTYEDKKTGLSVEVKEGKDGKISLGELKGNGMVIIASKDKNEGPTVITFTDGKITGIAGKGSNMDQQWLKNERDGLRNAGASASVTVSAAQQQEQKSQQPQQSSEAKATPSIVDNDALQRQAKEFEHWKNKAASDRAASDATDKALEDRLNRISPTLENQPVGHINTSKLVKNIQDTAQPLTEALPSLAAAIAKAAVPAQILDVAGHGKPRVSNVESVVKQASEVFNNSKLLGDISAQMQPSQVQTQQQQQQGQKSEAPAAIPVFNPPSVQGLAIKSSSPVLQPNNQHNSPTAQQQVIDKINTDKLKAPPTVSEQQAEVNKPQQQTKQQQRVAPAPSVAAPAPPLVAEQVSPRLDHLASIRSGIKLRSTPSAERIKQKLTSNTGASRGNKITPPPTHLKPSVVKGRS